MYSYAFICNAHNFLRKILETRGKLTIILLKLSRDKKYEYFEEPRKSSFHSSFRSRITSSFELS